MATTGLSTQQERTAAPSTVDGSRTSNAEGTSLASARADHGHATTYQATGTGGAARSFYSKFADVLSAKDFGAGGLGIGNDDAHIQAAINQAALAHGAVYLPAGTYNLSAALSIPAGVTLFGDGYGTILQVTATGVYGLTVNAVGDVEIRSLRLQGQGQLGGSASAIQLTDASRVRIRNVWVDAWEDQGIEVTRSAGTTYCQYVEVEDCVLTNCTASYAGCGVVFWGAKSSAIRGCRAIGNRIGFSFNDATDCLMEGNRAESSGQIGLTVDGISAGAGVAARNLLIGNHALNTATTTYGGIYIGNHASDTLLSGNICSGNTGAGIRFNGNPANAILKGNHLLSNGLAGILIGQSSNVVIQGNHARGNGQEGIYVDQTDDTVIEGNFCTGNDTLGTSKAGILLNESKRSSVTGNRCTGQTYGIRFAQSAILLDDVICAANNVIGNTTAIQDDTSKVVLVGNITAAGTRVAALTSMSIAAGNTIKGHLSSIHSAWDPASLAPGQYDSTTITVTGVALDGTWTLGVPTFSVALPVGVFLLATITAANTVTVVLVNLTTSTQDLASGTLRVDAWQH